MLSVTNPVNVFSLNSIPSSGNLGPDKLSDWANKNEYNKCKDSANKFKKDELKRLKEKKKQDGELTQETVLKDKCKVDPLEL